MRHPGGEDECHDPEERNDTYAHFHTSWLIGPEVRAAA
jgi:hypothetical protein